MGISRSVTQSPTAYDRQNLTAPKLGTRLAAGAGAALRANWRTVLSDAGFRYRIHPVEDGAGLVDADLTFGFEFLDPRRYGAAADGAADDSDALTQAIALANAVGTLAYVDLGGLSYASSTSVNILSRVVLINGTIVYTGSTDDTAIVQIGVTGGGTLARPAGVENVVATTASTASRLVGFRMDSLVRSSWVKDCFASMNEDATGTREHIGYELVAERIAVAAGGLTGCYQNKISGCTAYNCWAASRLYTRGTASEQLVDPQVNGNQVDVRAYACLRSAAIVEEGALENLLDLRADTFVGQLGEGTTIYVLDLRGLYNTVRLMEEIGTRADTQYTVRLAADAAYNMVDYHTQNIGTARVLDESTTNRNVLRFMRPTLNLGGDLICHSHYTQATPVGTSAVQEVRDQWVAPAPCVIVRCAARLDTAVTSGGQLHAYFAKNGVFASSNRIEFVLDEGTDTKYLDSDVSASTPIAANMVLGKGDTVSFAFTNSSGGALRCTSTMLVRFKSTEADG